MLLHMRAKPVHAVHTLLDTTEQKKLIFDFYLMQNIRMGMQYNAAESFPHLTL